MTTISELAGEAYGWFETRTRNIGTADEGEHFVTMKEGVPQWIHDMTMEAHGEFLPDDWRYASIRSVLDAIHQSDAANRDAFEYNGAHDEWADQNVDVYSFARYNWLASNLNRAGYCDEAREEGLVSEDATIGDRIGVGQYQESREIMESVLNSLTARLDEINAEEDDD